MTDTKETPSRAPGGPYTVAEIAQVLHRSERTIRREISEGRLPAVKVGRAYTVTRSDLVAYLGSENRVDDLFGGTSPDKEAHE